METSRRLPIGADVAKNGVHFRVWAPALGRIEVVLLTGPGKRNYPLAQESDGYFSGFVSDAGHGDRYLFRAGTKELPDPASRFQPEGPEGPSQVIDPTRFAWTDANWKGAALRQSVLYEMHIGTFTPEGTWQAAAQQLPMLADLGITVVELMALGDFTGQFGWGYDGVCLFAPCRLYGTPDDMRAFIDTAHALGIGVILDVVYNHFGPRGNYLSEFSKNYFSEKHENDWGKAINFDGPNSGPVREFYLTNAAYWIEEFHLDGLRLDATQAIYDESDDHILRAIGRQVRESAHGRSTFIINENEPQEAKIIRPIDRGGYGLDGMWNDDFHHSAMVALTGRNEAYYTDHLGRPQEFISSAKYGYLFQGQRYSWQEQRRGTSAFDLEPWQFVTFLQNHDQVANSGRGLRCDRLTSPGKLRAMTTLLLLGPGTPLLFQGQEFAASTPFFYFADHDSKLADEIRQGRAKFLSQFRRLDRPGLAGDVPNPADPATFDRCKLDHRERKTHASAYQLHKDLIALRRSDPVFAAQRRHGVDGAVLGEGAFVLRYFATTSGRDDRLVLVNLGADLHLDQAPEPLLAPPEGCAWAVLWSSESIGYGGEGTPPPETLDGWRIMGEAAVVLKPEPIPSRDPGAWKKSAAQAWDRRHRARTPMGH